MSGREIMRERTKVAGILGLGCALPSRVRANDDRALEPLRARFGGAGLEAALDGCVTRRVLGDGETLAGLMAAAGEAALAKAGVPREAIDRLYGYGTVSEHVTPNVLYEVHAKLGLPARTWVLPVHTDPSNFAASLVLAWEAIAAGHARYALVVVGAAWSRHVDYGTPPAAAIGDGAGAAVVGPGGALTFVGYETETRSEEYGVMAIRHGRGADGPTFALDPTRGLEVVNAAGLDAPPRLIRSLLARHGVEPSDVTLVAQQNGRTRMDHWTRALGVAAHLDTYAELGNLTLACVPVTLARKADEVTTKYLVLHHLGLGGHHTALLLERLHGLPAPGSALPSRNR